MPDPDAVVLPGLEGQCVAVTGAAEGIGRATALLAARSGALVAAGDTDASALRDLEHEATFAGLSITPVHADIGDPASITNFLDAATKLGRLRGVANLAAVEPQFPAADLTLEHWNEVITLVLTGAFLLTQGAANAIAEHGEGGAIVNLGSSAMGSGVEGLSAVSASRTGLLGLTRTFAREFGPRRVRVNLVSPGAVEGSPGWEPQGGPTEAIAASLPLGRLGRPVDIAHAVVFLMSDYAAWFTGQHVQVNGGALMH